MTQAPVITTDRLVLRAPERGDFDAYAKLLGSERAVYMGGPYTRRGAWDMFCNMTANWVLHGFGGWIIEDHDKTWLGEVCLWFPDHFPEPELGWTLTEAAEGKGYAFEAAVAARDWYWSTTGSKTVVSYISPENMRSAALAQRLGARLDENAVLPEGETRDETHVYRHFADAVEENT